MKQVKRWTGPPPQDVAARGQRSCQEGRRSAVAVVCLPVAAEIRPAPVGATWSVEDVLFADKAADFQVSPDGRWAVYVEFTAGTGDHVLHVRQQSG